MQYDIKQTGIGKKENIEWMILLTLSLKERHNESKYKEQKAFYKLYQLLFLIRAVICYNQMKFPYSEGHFPLTEMKINLFNQLQ